jgi:uncharacterized membrane protein YkvA (DUF1232 family)
MDSPAAPEFAAALERFVHEYTGSRERAVRWAPAVFQMYARLWSDPRTPRSARAIVNAVLAYFVVPDDVMPEGELGPVGLMDDLFVAAHAHRILRRELPEAVLADAWRGDGDLDEAMAEVWTESRAELGKRARDVLRLAGLS